MTTKTRRRRMCLNRIQSIFVMHEKGETNRYISAKCGCSASTVSDTLRKYCHPDELIWGGMNSYEKAKYVWDMQKSNVKRRSRFRGSIPDVEKQEYIEEKLINENWSPEIISFKMQEELGKSVATSTIYRFIKLNGRRLKKYLYERGKPRRQRVTHRRGRFQKKEREEKKYIHVRPEAVNARLEFGHWEGDLVVGPQRGSKYVILSLIERLSRKKQFIRMPNREAETTRSYLRAFFLSLPPEARKSVTLDNGVEFAPSAMHKLEKLFSGFQVYYTEPYSPEQKGSDEHANGRLRKTFPKKTDFAFVSKQRIQEATSTLNNRPMKLHGFRTPEEVFQQELSLVTHTLQNVA